MTKRLLTTNQIVILLGLLCIAVTSSLFLYRFHQQPKQTVIATANGTFFPIGREIKPFELQTSNQQAFSEKNFRDHWTLMLFGFTHCMKVCPVNMSLMQRVYPQLHTIYPNLQVVLISVDPDRDDTKTVTAYAHSFNPAFIGVTGKIQHLRKLQSQLGIYVGTDAESTADNYQIDHTPSILLINPAGRMVGLLSYGQSPADFTKTFLEGMKIL
jgi:protein SCO1/2